MSITLSSVEARFDLTHLDHLDRQADVPVVSTVGFQGDVAVVRRDVPAADAAIPRGGFPVVRGENGGNTHLLVGDGAFDSRTPDAFDLRLGVLTVPGGGTTLLSHPEHGALLIAPGTYEIRRQREQADELRMVAD